MLRARIAACFFSALRSRFSLTACSRALLAAVCGFRLELIVLLSHTQPMRQTPHLVRAYRRAGRAVCLPAPLALRRWVPRYAGGRSNRFRNRGRDRRRRAHGRPPVTKDQRLTTWVLVSAVLMVVGVFTTLYDRQHVQHVIDQTGIFGQALVNVGWGL